MTEKLSEVMRGHNVFDTEEGQAHRLYVLGKLNELMQRWIIRVSVDKVREDVIFGFQDKLVEVVSGIVF